ncbi:MAG: ABC transporter permease [Bacillota bacterium]|nr:ABC transporter permease [Bacillota bacterium]
MKKRNWIAYPHIVWMAIFVLVPVFIVLYYSIVSISDNGIQLTLKHFARVFEPLYLNVFIRSIELALISTAICLLLGYPAAMILASKNLSKRNMLIVLVIIPMWMNFLARTYAWMTLLERNGLIDTIVKAIGLPPLNIMYTDYAVVLGMVYNFLPFMILPIYSVLSKTNKSVIEAAEDLGATPMVTFKRIVFPLSLPGVMSGITMVFLPAVTTFVISELLGGGQYTLIGNLIQQQFTLTMDWGFGSALSIFLMILILISMGIMSKYEKENEGGGLW